MTPQKLAENAEAITINQALSEMQATTRWVRPLTWRGAGQALCWDSETGRILLVPGLTGGILPRLSREMMTNMWEVVAPEVVHRENERKAVPLSWRNEPSADT